MKMKMLWLLIAAAACACGGSTGSSRPVIGVSMAHFDDNWLTILRTAMVEHAACPVVVVPMRPRPDQVLDLDLADEDLVPQT